MIIRPATSAVFAFAAVAASAIPPLSASAAQRYAQATSPSREMPPSPIDIFENPEKAFHHRSEQERREACDRDRSAKNNAAGSSLSTAILDQAMEVDCAK